MSGSLDKASADSTCHLPGSHGGQFATTRWTIVLNAGRSDSGVSRSALSQLCQAYWYPLYAFVRREGYSAHDAQDLTQAFFARLIEKHALGAVERSKGRFRSFLLASLKHFLFNEWDKVRAQKRGGGHVFISMDEQSAETRYAIDPSHNETADRIYERHWALTLLDQVLVNLRQEYDADGRSELFEQLKTTLTGEKGTIAYADMAGHLGMKEGAVKVAVHRLRRRYRELLREMVRDTVADASEVDEELRHLLTVLSRP